MRRRKRVQLCMMYHDYVRLTIIFTRREWPLVKGAPLLWLMPAGSCYQCQRQSSTELRPGLTVCCCWHCLAFLPPSDMTYSAWPRPGETYCQRETTGRHVRIIVTRLQIIKARLGSCLGQSHQVTLISFMNNRTAEESDRN